MDDNYAVVTRENLSQHIKIGMKCDLIDIRNQIPFCSGVLVSSSTFPELSIAIDGINIAWLSEYKHSNDPLINKKGKIIWKNLICKREWGWNAETEIYILSSRIVLRLQWTPMMILYLLSTPMGICQDVNMTKIC